MKLSVDHIVPWIMSGVDEEAANHDDNLASLCSVCHGVKTHRIEPRLLKGDWLSLVEFYGQEIADRAMARFTG